jgi:hypothetical protein
MQVDDEGFPSEENFDVPDDEDEDEIMAELRKIREQMLLEYPTHDALFQLVKAAEAEEIRQGRQVVSLPPRHPHSHRPNAA